MISFKVLKRLSLSSCKVFREVVISRISEGVRFSTSAFSLRERKSSVLLRFSKIFSRCCGLARRS